MIIIIKDNRLELLDRIEISTIFKMHLKSIKYCFSFEFSSNNLCKFYSSSLNFKHCSKYKISNQIE